MKCTYKKINTFKLFGIKILEFNSKYIEHSNDKDSDEDDFYIDLTTKELGRNA